MHIDTSSETENKLSRDRVLLEFNSNADVINQRSSSDIYIWLSGCYRVWASCCTTNWYLLAHGYLVSKGFLFLRFRWWLQCIQLSTCPVIPISGNLMESYCAVIYDDLTLLEDFAQRKISMINKDLFYLISNKSDSLP